MAITSPRSFTALQFTTITLIASALSMGAAEPQNNAPALKTPTPTNAPTPTNMSAQTKPADNANAKPPAPPNTAAQAHPAGQAPVQSGPTVQQSPAKSNDAHPAPGFGTGAPRGSTGAYGNHDANAAGTTLDRADRHFIETVASEAETELALASLGAERAQDPRVRDYAEMLSRDHMVMTTQLAPVLHDKNVPVENDLKADRVYRSVSEASPTHFDAKFVEAMIDWHRRDLKRFEETAQNSKDEELRKFASSHLELLRRHLQQAEELQHELHR